MKRSYISQQTIQMDIFGRPVDILVASGDLLFYTLMKQIFPILGNATERNFDQHRWLVHVDVMLCDKSNANRETIIKSWEDDKNPFRFESLQVDAAIKVSALETHSYKNKPYATATTVTTVKVM